MKLVRFFCALAMMLVATQAWSVEPDEVLSDPALETRARQISTELRCLVCQNQSIDDSDAPLAKDLRVLIRERLTAGDGDGQVVDFVVARYGEFVLLRPRFAPHTWALWLGGPAIFILGCIVIFVSFRRRQREATGTDGAPLSDDERAKLERLLDDV